MEKLAQTITEALERFDHYLIPPEELNRIWPDQTKELREQKLRDFARAQGWDVFSYHSATGAYLVRKR
jgi:hypothetical protein